MKARAWSLLLVLAGAAAGADDRDLIGHWKLAEDARDSSGAGRHGVNRGAAFGRGTARFDGRRSHVEVPAPPLGTGDFTLAVWVDTAAALDDTVGDILSRYDPAKRRGLTWGIKNGAGATNTQANFRNIHFGIDNGTEPRWHDRGRPGNGVYVMALAVHDGHLYAGTCEPGKEEAGHVHRYAGGTRWEDCGSPDRSNAVTSLAVHDGKLYAGTGKYRLAGSALPESPNTTLGGKVYRYEGDRKWVDCGQLPKAEAVGGMAVFRGRLYATSLYRPAGFFRYEGGTRWEPAGLPPGERRVGALAPFNGHLYAGSYDGCAVFRYDGRTWGDLGRLEASGQTYSFEIHHGNLHVGTWPNGRVYRLDGERTWADVGRLGKELEVMGMAVHNGKLYAGTLPLAEVYRYDGDGAWTNTGRLDRTPDVRYRRAWSMALYQGRLFCGVLPSGRVHALEAGRAVTHDRALSPGRHHLAAVKGPDRLRLYVDGKEVAASEPFERSAFDLGDDRPLTVGAGPHDVFNGSLSDLRLYGRALTAAEVAALARRPPAPPSK